MQTLNIAAAHLIINRLVVVFILRSDQRFKACMVHLIAPRGGLPTPRPRIGRLRLDRYRPVNCEPRIRPPHRLPVLYAVKGNTECVEGVACVGCVGGEYHTRAKAGGDSSQTCRPSLAWETVDKGRSWQRKYPWPLCCTLLYCDRINLGFVFHVL